MFTHYRRVFETLQPYLLATQEVAPLLEQAPLGVDLAADGLILDPQLQANEPFLTLLRHLDQLAFGTLGMAMPSWVFYDCGVMPSAVFGFAAPAHVLEPWVRRALSIPDDYDGPVPVSIFIAIPTLEKGSFFTHTLCSLNRICEGAVPGGLELLSLALGVRVLKAEALFGATQWRSEKLATYASFGPLELVTAWTPSHSMSKTVTWRLQLKRYLTEAAILKPGASPAAPPPTHMLDVDNEAALKGLQAEIEAGIPYQLVGPPLRHGSFVTVPIHRGAGL